jgi:hypothetical protein
MVDSKSIYILNFRQLDIISMLIKLIEIICAFKLDTTIVKRVSHF